MFVQKAGTPSFSCFGLRVRRVKKSAKAWTSRCKARIEKGSAETFSAPAAIGGAMLPMLGAEQRQHDVLNDNGLEYDKQQL